MRYVYPVPPKKIALQLRTKGTGCPIVSILISLVGGEGVGLGSNTVDFYSS